MNPTASEMGINLESQQELESLSGKELPANWPQIISSEGEDKIYAEKIKDPDKDLVIEHLSFYLSNGDKELAYLAVQHIGGLENKNHPQFAKLKEYFDKFKPQVVLHESPVGSPVPESMSEEDAYKHGEKAFLMFLVIEHNKNLKPEEQPIVIEGVDIPDEVAYEEFRKLGYTIGIYK